MLNLSGSCIAICGLFKNRAIWPIDPIAEKMYGMSPYTYCFGNPVNYVDPDGQRGKIIINEQEKTITIYAVYYYYVAKDENNAQDVENLLRKDIAFFNDARIFYPYKYRLHGKEISGLYEIRFDLRMVLVSSKRKAKRSAKADPIGNRYTIKDLSKTKKGRKLKVEGKVLLGNTKGKWDIEVDKAYIDTDASAHEIGHTLGMEHSEDHGGGLMTSILSDKRHSRSLGEYDIDNMLSYLPIYVLKSVSSEDQKH